MSKEIAVFWYRRDLRVKYNAGLYYALRDQLPVLPFFIFDREILDDLEDKEDARVEFIQCQVEELHRFFSTKGGTLQAYYDTPLDAFKKLTKEYNVKAIFTNRDYEPYAHERDHLIEKYTQENGIGFYSFKDQVIFEEGEILTGSNEPYKVFTPFKNKWIDKFKQQKVSQFDVESHLNNLLKSDKGSVPKLEEMGFKKSSIEVPKPVFKEDIIRNYSKKRNFPSLNGTSRLGIHLRHGTISIREAVAKAKGLSESWLNELIWREFYMMILAHFPHVVTKAFKSKYDRIPWRDNKEDFEKWCEGKTGYPIVDAGMRELNKSGYMHNRSRMITASFLTKHLLIDWRWGEQYFAKKLLDYELSSNNGGWQWAAGTGTDAQPYFRVFNPYSQQHKFDKDYKYVKKWVEEYGTEDYPEPIVEHKLARERAISTYKEAIS
mgnify:FL=1